MRAAETANQAALAKNAQQLKVTTAKIAELQIEYPKALAALKLTP
jgi:hypothetical protein